MSIVNDLEPKPIINTSADVMLKQIARETVLATTWIKHDSNMLGMLCQIVD